jgi:hypothetical protein
MLSWTLTFFSFLIGIATLLSGLEDRARSLLLNSEEKLLERLDSTLSEIQVRLESGLVPRQALWDEVSRYREPWGTLCSQSLQELRQSGGAVLPTLKRLRELARSQREQMRGARSRASQALSQAVVGGALVPLMSGLLYSLLPGVAESGWIWWLGTGFAFSAAGLGALWLLSIADDARWGGLPRQQRPWVLEAAVGGERFLAVLRSGTPPDIAWSRVCDGIRIRAGGLAELWGHQLYADLPDTSGEQGRALFREFGEAIRRSVQTSVMEGRPCAERVEQVVESFRKQWRDQVERELGLLGTRALKPLFVCVAPALLGLLGLGMAIALDQAINGI